MLRVKPSSGWALLMVLVCFAIASPPSAMADGPRIEHSMWQWYEASGITPDRMRSVAPNFPRPTITSDTDGDLKRYNNALLRWTYLYPHEYEAFVNAPELTALNPYYSEYVHVYRRPRFVDVSITLTKPQPASAPVTFEDTLYYELQLMKWMFVFHPEAFAGVYGFSPTLPPDMDVELWRIEQAERAAAARIDTEKDGDGPPVGP